MFKQHLILASAALCLAVSAHAGTVYLADSTGNLWSGDPVTGIFALVGNSSRTTAMADIDFKSDGTLWGVGNDNNLYSINQITGAGTLIGGTGVGFLAGLAGDDAGHLYGGGVNNIYTINTTTGAGTVVGTGGGGYNVSGDLEFIGTHLYLTSTGPGSAGGGGLWSVNTTTGVGTYIGDTTFTAVWGLAYDTQNGVLYGFTSNAAEIAINPATGAGTFLFANVISTANGNQLLGAAFQPAVPEPATFILFGFGVSVLGLLRQRRK